jgi:magnesium chelatase subunit D
MAMENSMAAKQVALGNNLRLFLGRNQGVRVGESAVVSRRVHQPHPQDPRRVKVLIEQDAGKTFCGFNEPEQAVHIDVYHDPATIEIQPAARRIWAAIDTFLETQGSELMIRKEEDRLTQPSAVAGRIYLATAEDRGYVARLMRQGYDDYAEIAEDLRDHVHLVMELPEEWYPLVVSLVDAVETAILEQGYNIRKISGVVNGYGKASHRELGLMLPFFGKRKPGDEVIRLQNQNQLIMELAKRLGSVEDVEEFMNSMQGNVFKRMAQTSVKKRHRQQDLDQLAEQMSTLGLVKKVLLGYSLTDEGKDLRQHLMINRKELEAELRKIVRRIPGKNRRYQRTSASQMKCRAQEVLNLHKILTRDDENASNSIAVPETILQGASRSLREGQKRVTIKPEDIRVYGKKSFIPMDVCLLVDCSASMAGEKSRAAWQLAEHLLLTLREKVAVVTFQEMDAKVAVPFTRNHHKLIAGLRTVVPEGMTPLASGIMKSLDLIKQSKVKNPLLILITDGMPTYPHWSFDSKEDAIKAAEEVKKAKVRLTCIGVRSNRDFLAELAKAGDANLYVVDNLNRDTLVQVVHDERQELKQAL